MRYLLIILLFFSIASAQDTLLVVGDSKSVATNAWRDSLISAGYAIISSNMATAGWETADAVTNVDAYLALITNTPDMVLCNLGINDVTHHIGSIAVKTNYDYVVDAIHAKWADAKIYVCHVWENADNNYIDTVNAAINTLFAENSYLLEGHDERVWLASDPETYLTDAIHYSAAGEVKCAEEWETILNTESPSGETGVYYISSDGDDANSGLTPSLAWKTLDKISTTTFSPGDSIRFKCGQTFYGEMSKSGNGFVGTEALPIYFGNYGTGAKPILMGDCSEGEWIQDTRRDSLWKKWIGTCHAAAGWQCVNGTWVTMTNINPETKFYLSTPDSLSAYLDKFTQSSYDATTYTGWDTLYCQTHDGLSPQDSTIFFRNNVLTGNWLIIYGLEFRSYNCSINPFPLKNSIIRQCEFRDNRFCSIILQTHSDDNLVDSCTIHNGGYTGFYSHYSHRNIFRYDTVRQVQHTVRGTYGGAEQAGFGAERDTACVWEYCYADSCSAGSFDAFFNYADTIRHSTFNNGYAGGLFLNGDSWVAHDNVVTANSGILLSIGRYHTLPVGELGLCHIYDNTITVNRSSYNTAGTGIVMQNNYVAGTYGNGSGGTALFENNTVTGTYSNSGLGVYTTTVGLTTINNHFFSPGRFVSGAFPDEVYYTSLSALQTATGLEAGSTWNEVPPETPIITVSVTSHEYGNVLTEDYSDEFSFTISGVYLTPASGNITVTAPTGFEVSLTTGSGFASSVNAAYTSSTLASTTIYSRFAPLLAQYYSGNITVAGGGATTKNVSVTGTGTDADELNIVSGNNQGALPNAVLNPFIVNVLSGDTPVVDVYITWQIYSYPEDATGMTLTSYSANTDENGQATTTLTLGSLPGVYVVRATALGLPAYVEFTSTAIEIPTGERAFSIFGK